MMGRPKKNIVTAVIPVAENAGGNLLEKNPKKKSEVGDGSLITAFDGDRVGNVEQKERNLAAANITRLYTYKKIYEMMNAVKRVTAEDLDGKLIVLSEEPDMAIRAKGVELAMKAFGDLKEFERVVNGNVTNNTVIYKWGDVKTVNNNDVQVINESSQGN